jgi:hypothetical protein
LKINTNNLRNFFVTPPTGRMWRIKMKPESVTTNVPSYIPLAPGDPKLPDPWQSMDTLGETAYFDVIAKYYDAGFDMMLCQRFCNCFRQGGKTYWPHPFVVCQRIPVGSLILEDHGFKPILWMPTPNNPKELP